MFCFLDFGELALLPPEILELLHQCQYYNIPLATNYSTAEAIATHLAQVRLAHLIFNPVAGKGDAQQDLALIQTLLEPHMNLQIQLTTPEVSAEHLAAQAVAAQADLVIASGGDGTVSAVAGALIGTEVPLGVIPRGTANAFCLALGIPSAIAPIRRACQVILFGKPKTIDAARCNGLPMVLLAGIGYEANAVNKASRESKDQWGALAYLMAGWQQLDEQRVFETEIELDGDVYHLRSGAITVANAAPPTSVLAQGGGKVVFDDGLLDVTIAVGREGSMTIPKKLKIVTNLVRVMGSALVGNTPAIENLVHVQAQRIKITAHPPQKVVIDGEVIHPDSVEIVCVPQGLTVILPAAPL